MIVKESGRSGRSRGRNILRDNPELGADISAAMTNTGGSNKTGAEAIADRIDSRRKELKRTLKGPNGVLGEAGLSDSFVADLRRKPNSSPRMDSLQALATVLGVRLAWLAEGRPPKLAPGAGAAQTSQSSSDLLVIPEFRVLTSTLRGGRVAADSSAMPGQLELPARWMLPLAESPESLSYTEKKGDAMVPVLLNGDAVVIDRAQRSPSQSGLYAILLFEKDELIIRRVQRVPGNRLNILAENPAYPPIELPIDDVEIVGRVVWFGRRM